MSVMSRSAVGTAAAYLASLEAAGVSRSVRRQRAWALREAVLFAAAGSMRGGGDVSPLTPEELAAAEGRVGRIPLGALFAPGFADDWVARADGLLRARDDAPDASQRARLTSLRALAVFAGAEAPAHARPKPALREVLEPPRLEAALRALAGPLPGRGHDDQVRLAAVLAVMSVWPARSAELCALRRDDLRDDDARLLLTVPGGGAGLELRGLAADRVRDWLVVRQALAAGLQGGPVHALWTSIRSNSRPGGRTGSLPLPPGMPLRPRGLQRAYARSVRVANAVFDGSSGFPLPPSLDLLRRSFQATPS